MSDLYRGDTHCTEPRRQDGDAESRSRDGNVLGGCRPSLLTRKNYRLTHALLRTILSFGIRHRPSI
jgi:hypothetical protein